MKGIIGNLDDMTAIRVLRTIAQSNRKRAGSDSDWTPESIGILCESLGVAASEESPTEGELAREALLLLSEDSQYHAPIKALIDQPKVRSFAEPSTILLTAAVIFALQTHIKIEKDKAGKWKMLFEKKPTKEALLKALVSKLAALMTKRR